MKMPLTNFTTGLARGNGSVSRTFRGAGSAGTILQGFGKSTGRLSIKGFNIGIGDTAPAGSGYSVTVRVAYIDSGSLVYLCDAYTITTGDAAYSDVFVSATKRAIPKGKDLVVEAVTVGTPTSSPTVSVDAVFGASHGTRLQFGIVEGGFGYSLTRDVQTTKNKTRRWYLGRTYGRFNIGSVNYTACTDGAGAGAKVRCRVYYTLDTSSSKNYLTNSSTLFIVGSNFDALKTLSATLTQAKIPGNARLWVEYKTLSANLNNAELLGVQISRKSDNLLKTRFPGGLDTGVSPFVCHSNPGGDTVFPGNVYLGKASTPLRMRSGRVTMLRTLTGSGHQVSCRFFYETDGSTKNYLTSAESFTTSNNLYDVVLPAVTDSVIPSGARMYLETTVSGTVSQNPLLFASVDLK
tara:strand:- start:1302 stop:2522 length:1221 start_codon:yes stop_codon:yes gene_type:complete